MTDFFFVLFFSLFRSKNPIRQRWKVWEVPGTGTIAIGETMETIGWRWSVSFLFFFQETKKHRYYYCCCCLAHCQTGRKLADSKGWSCGDAKNKKGKTDADPHTHTHTHTHARNKKKAKKKTRKKKKWGNETRQQDASYDKPADTFCIFHQKENERERERERDKLPFSASRLSRRRPVQGVSLFLAGHVLFYFFLGNRFHFFFVCVAPSDFVRRWIEPGFIYGTDEFNREGSSFIIIIIITIIIVFHSIVDEADGLQVLIDTEPKQRTTMRSIQFRGFTGF